MSPFDDPDALYCVLVDTQGRHSLWPTASGVPTVPGGWTVVVQGASRETCIAYIDEQWDSHR
ncbi:MULTISPECIES: MbtH family protein [Streptomyces]|uniref:MbtH family protein n=1 Tax=Streptomyces heilongjiangensis TaxID=945052 RepID=A0ABW1B0K6_9ACTN|nr:MULTISPECIES: MbtH family protein [Streptomyces]MDC2945632.1 MbtH family protein [Streptomyces heilongjiangensis]